MRQVIRADLDLARRPALQTSGAPFCAARAARASQADRSENPWNGKPFRRRRRSRPGRGRAEGQGRAIRCLPPAPGSRCWTPICAAIRPPPGRCAPAWRFRAPPPPPKSCASTPTKPRCATCASPSATALGPAANLLSLWRDLAGRPPSLDPGRIPTRRRGSTWLVDPNGLAASLKACAGEGDPVSAAAKAAALAFSAFPDAPAAEAEIFALWVFDIVLAIRLRWPRPVPLIATKILDPTLRSAGAGRRPRPGDPAWPNAAAGAIALAAASALDLAADLSRRSEHSDRRRAQTALETGPKNRRPPACPRLRLARRGRPPRADDRPRRPPAVRPARRARRRPRTLRAGRRSGCTSPSTASPCTTSPGWRSSPRRAS